MKVPYAPGLGGGRGLACAGRTSRGARGAEAPGGLEAALIRGGDCATLGVALCLRLISS